MRGRAPRAVDRAQWRKFADEREQFLKRSIDARPEVEVKFGVAFESFEEKDDRVVAVLQEQGSGAQEQVSCQYLIGCDGG